MPLDTPLSLSEMVRQRGLQEQPTLTDRIAQPMTPEEASQDSLRREASELSELGKGFRSGIEGMYSGVQNLAGTAGEAFGADRFARRMYDAADRNSLRSQILQPRINDTNQIEGPQSLQEYISGNVGNAFASTLPAIIPGAGVGLRAALLRRAAPAAQAWLAGAAGMFPQEAGEYAGRIRNENPNVSPTDRLAMAAGVGGVNSVLESAVPNLLGVGSLVGKGGGRSLRQVLTRPLVTGGEAVLGEGATEGAQQAVQLAALNEQAPNRDRSGDAREIWQSAAAGAAGGGGLVAPHAAGRLALDVAQTDKAREYGGKAADMLKRGAGKAADTVQGYRALEPETRNEAIHDAGVDLAESATDKFNEAMNSAGGFWDKALDKARSWVSGIKPVTDVSGEEATGTPINELIKRNRERPDALKTMRDGLLSSPNLTIGTKRKIADITDFTTDAAKAAITAAWQEDKDATEVARRSVPFTQAMDNAGAPKPVSTSADMVLDAVDRGGVPAFITNNLKRVAAENGITITDKDTPGHIIAQLRAKRDAFREHERQQGLSLDDIASGKVQLSQQRTAFHNAVSEIPGLDDKPELVDRMAALYNAWLQNPNSTAHSRMFGLAKDEGGLSEKRLEQLQGVIARLSDSKTASWDEAVMSAQRPGSPLQNELTSIFENLGLSPHENASLRSQLTEYAQRVLSGKIRPTELRRQLYDRLSTGLGLEGTQLRDTIGKLITAYTLHFGTARDPQGSQRTKDTLTAAFHVPGETASSTDTVIDNLTPAGRQLLSKKLGGNIDLSPGQEGRFRDTRVRRWVGELMKAVMELRTTGIATPAQREAMLKKYTDAFTAKAARLEAAGDKDGARELMFKLNRISQDLGSQRVDRKAELLKTLEPLFGKNARQVLNDLAKIAVSNERELRQGEKVRKNVAPTPQGGEVGHGQYANDEDAELRSSEDEELSAKSEGETGTHSEEGPTHTLAGQGVPHYNDNPERTARQETDAQRSSRMMTRAQPIPAFDHLMSIEDREERGAEAKRMYDAVKVADMARLQAIAKDPEGGGHANERERILARQRSMEQNGPLKFFESGPGSLGQVTRVETAKGTEIDLEDRDIQHITDSPDEQSPARNFKMARGEGEQRKTLSINAERLVRLVLAKTKEASTLLAGGTAKGGMTARAVAAFRAGMAKLTEMGFVNNGKEPDPKMVLLSADGRGRPVTGQLERTVTYADALRRTDPGRKQVEFNEKAIEAIVHPSASVEVAQRKGEKRVLTDAEKAAARKQGKTEAQIAELENPKKEESDRTVAEERGWIYRGLERDGKFYTLDLRELMRRTAIAIGAEDITGSIDAHDDSAGISQSLAAELIVRGVNALKNAGFNVVETNKYNHSVFGDAVGKVKLFEYGEDSNRTPVDLKYMRSALTAADAYWGRSTSEQGRTKNEYGKPYRGDYTVDGDHYISMQEYRNYLVENQVPADLGGMEIGELRRLLGGGMGGKRNARSIEHDEALRNEAEAVAMGQRKWRSASTNEQRLAAHLLEARKHQAAYEQAEREQDTGQMQQESQLVKAHLRQIRNLTSGHARQALAQRFKKLGWVDREISSMAGTRDRRDDTRDMMAGETNEAAANRQNTPEEPGAAGVSSKYDFGDTFKPGSRFITGGERGHGAGIADTEAARQADEAKNPSQGPEGPGTLYDRSQALKGVASRTYATMETDERTQQYLRQVASIRGEPRPTRPERRTHTVVKQLSNHPFQKGEKASSAPADVRLNAARQVGPTPSKPSAAEGRKAPATTEPVGPPKPAPGLSKEDNDRLNRMMEGGDPLKTFRRGGIGTQRMDDAARQSVTERVTHLLQSFARVVFGEDAVNSGWVKDEAAPELAAAIRQLITISNLAADPMATTNHEAWHAFSKILSASPNGKKLVQMVERAVSTPLMQQWLASKFVGDDKALKQIAESASERASYAFQLFAAKEQMPAPEAAKGLWNKLMGWLKQLAGITPDHIKLQKLFGAFDSGRLVFETKNAEALSHYLAYTKREQFLHNLDSWTQPLQEVAQRALSTSLARVRAIDHPIAQEIADRYAGKTAGRGGFFYERARMDNIFANRLADAIRGVDLSPELLKSTGNYLRAVFMDRGKKDQTMTRTVLSELRAELAARGIKDPEAVIETFTRNADKIAKIEEELVEYQKKAGVKNPVTFWGLDRNRIDDNREEFIQDVMAGGKQRKEANDSMIGYMHYASFPDFFDTDTVHGKEMFNKWAQPDVQEAYNDMIRAAVLEAETKRWLEPDTGPYAKQSVEDLLTSTDKKLTPDERKTLRDFSLSMRHMLGADINPALRKFNNAAMLVTNTLLLPWGLFSQFLDVMQVASRSNKLGDAFKTLGRAIKDMPRAIKSWDAKHQKDFWERTTESMGMLSSQHLGAFMSDILMGGRAGRDWTAKANDAFFRYNGMAGWQRSVIIEAVRAAHDFLRDHATNPTEQSERLLDELGLKASDIKVDKDGMVDMSSDKIQQGISQFVREAVGTPDPGSLPMWMNNPHFALLAHLKRFTFAYTTWVLGRVARQATKFGNWAAALPLMLAVPWMIGADYLRDMLTPGSNVLKDSWDFSDYLKRGVERAGLLGRWQFAGDVGRATSMGQSGVVSLLGPEAQIAESILQGHNMGGFGRAWKGILGIVLGKPT